MTNSDNFKVIEYSALPTIEGTEDTVFALGACWHGKHLTCLSENNG